MNRTVLLLVLVVAGVGLGGCSVAGTWKTVQVVPADAVGRFPAQFVTFDKEGRYTATGGATEGAGVVVGTYTWDGFSLRLTPKTGEETRFSGTLWWNKRLELSGAAEGQKYGVTLQRTPPQ